MSLSRLWLNAKHLESSGSGFVDASTLASDQILISLLFSSHFFCAYILPPHILPYLFFLLIRVFLSSNIVLLPLLSVEPVTF